MSRFILADQILFNECIEAFRSSKKEPFIFDSIDNCYSVILSPFVITQTWELGIFTIEPSREVKLSMYHNAFISYVKINKEVNRLSAPLYSQALSSILSFISLRHFKAIKNSYFHNQLPNITNPEILNTFAVNHPIITCGPSAESWQIDIEEERIIFDQTKLLIEYLYKIEYKNYSSIMQSLRMVQMSLSNKREDFGLAYQLIVASIESVAQLAISRDKVKEKHLKESTWKNKSKTDPDFLELYNEYKRSRGGNQYLSDRYAQFIMTYFPYKKWSTVLKSPLQEFIDKIDYNSLDNFGIQTSKQEIERSFTGIQIEDLNENEIKEIIKKTYKYRSEFVHQGKQPPHKDPDSRNTFFEDTNKFNENTISEQLLPKYDLMCNIAKNSILNFMYDVKI